MGATESEAMKKARKLVTQGGLTPYAAAQRTGLARSAIYMAPWYKGWKKDTEMSRHQHACQARQYSDQMICATCGLAWDMNDPDPPQCLRFDARTRQAKATAKFEAEAQSVTGSKLPPELPPHVVSDMDKTYKAHGGGPKGMRAAYRLLLDTMEI